MADLTIFTAPKPFTNPHIALIQRNAIRSWLSLGPQVEVILLGEEDGLAEAAAELGVKHLPEVARNASGTPLVSSMFDLARQHSTSPLAGLRQCGYPAAARCGPGRPGGCTPGAAVSDRRPALGPGRARAAGFCARLARSACASRRARRASCTAPLAVITLSSRATALPICLPLPLGAPVGITG